MSNDQELHRKVENLEKQVEELKNMLIAWADHHELSFQRGPYVMKGSPYMKVVE